MEIAKFKLNLQELAAKYKYAILVLLVGLVLLLIPGKSTQIKKADIPIETVKSQQMFTQEALEEILQTVQGAGRVKVLLSMATGEETVYQADSESTSGGDDSDSSIKTVIITDAQRNESGLIRQVNPAVFQGAIVVCQGADNPTVRLTITQAVSKITGLGADAICVLKMQ